jgi:hypothetical protein
MPNRMQVSNAIGFAKFYSRSHPAVIRAFDEAGNIVETEEHAGDFREPMGLTGQTVLFFQFPISKVDFS